MRRGGKIKIVPRFVKLLNHKASDIFDFVDIEHNRHYHAKFVMGSYISMLRDGFVETRACEFGYTLSSNTLIVKKSITFHDIRIRDPNILYSSILIRVLNGKEDRYEYSIGVAGLKTDLNY